MGRGAAGETASMQNKEQNMRAGTPASRSGTPVRPRRHPGAEARRVTPATPRKRRARPSTAREMERRYMSVVEDQTEIISRFTEDGTLTFVNEVYCRFFGKTRRELLGSKWHPRALPEDVPMISEKLRSMSPVNQVVVIENRVCSSTGEVHWMQFVNRGFFDPAGRLIETQSVGRDITNLKRVTADLEASQQALRSLSARMEAVREQERQKLARDIHDTFGHALTDWRFDFAWLERRLAEAGLDGRTAIQRRLSAMARRAEAEMESVRRIASALRPALLDTLGLSAAIEWLAREMQSRGGIRCHVTVPPPALVFAAPQSIAIFRIAQELLTNVARHSRAQSVNISLEVRDGWIELLVRDDGCGITDAAAGDPASLGLLGIRERAASLGGGLEIQGLSNRGTTARVRLPMAQPVKQD